MDTRTLPLKRFVLAIATSLALAFTIWAPPALHATSSNSQEVQQLSPGLARLEAAPEVNGALIGIARVDAAAGPTLAQLTRLSALGLRVWGYRRLPFAVVHGSKTQMRAAVATGAARDIYPNDQVHWHWDESNKTVRADLTQAAGFDGSGVGVAIVDSGIDATHPALTDRVTHNVKIVSPEYLQLAGVPASATPTEPYFPVPVDQTPYNNSDSLSGHGTHVAGIVAANGKDPDHPALVGVAPKANLIGYSTGDVAVIVTILAAYDHILANHAEWNIHVVNNSWGSSFRAFDPNDPIQVATKAVHDAGLVVTFSAGNDGEQATINPYSVAPWVISVGSGTTAKQRSSFSSGGLRFDNSGPTAVPPDKHQQFIGDRIGLYHPDVTAPGSDILSTGTPVGAYVGPTEPGGEVEASGTSMSAPHVAGAAAVVLQAARGAKVPLTPDRVRDVLQVTSTPLADNTPFWHAGYGYIDVKAAVDLVRGRGFNLYQLLRLQTKRNIAVQGARDWAVRSSDVWSFQALPATAFGFDAHSFTINVDSLTKGLYATVEFPTTPLIGVNLFEYLLTVKDAAGKVVATTTTSSNAGTGNVLVDLRTVPGGVTNGTWTIDITGSVGASDSILLGNTITVTAAQLRPQLNRSEAPSFVPTGSQVLFFSAGAATLPGSSQEGCDQDQGAPDGGMVALKPIGACRSGVVGYTLNYAADMPAQFTSQPLAAPVTIGGDAKFVIYLVDAAQPAWAPIFASGLAYTIVATDPSGNVIPIATGEAPELTTVGPTPTRGVYTAAIPAVTLPAGVMLSVEFQFSGFYTSSMRFLYGGGVFADAGATFVTGTNK